MQEANQILITDKKYAAIFNNIPVALLIEDFSKAFTYLKSIELENESVESYLKNNPKELFKLASLIEIKDVNAKALELYKATSKEELLGNLDKLFFYKSVKGFSKLIEAVYYKKNIGSVKSYNKSLVGGEIIISINYQIIKGDEEKLKNVIVSIEDCTENELTFEKLITNKNILSNALTSVNEGLVILDKNSNYLFVNDEAEQLLGKDKTYLIGKNLWIEFPEKEGDLFYDNYYKAIETNSSISFENYFAPWNSWFENRITPFSDGVLIFFKEINDKREKEERIKEAYNIINKSSSVAFLVKVEKDFPFVFASKNSDKIFEYSHTEFLNNSIRIFDIVYPNDLEFVRNGFFNFIKNKTETQFKPKPVRIVTKSGKIKWVEVRFDSILNDKNEISHVQGIVHDVSDRIDFEQKLFESSQQLQYQFNNMPLASIIWDLDFNVLEWNNAATKIFGYTEKEAKKILTKNFLTPPNAIPTVKEDILNKFWNEINGFRNTNENITKSGNIILCDWYNIAIRDAEGNVTSLATFADDITERTRAKELLEISEKRYRDIFEKSVDAVFVLKNSVIADCNQSSLEIFGFNTKDEIINLHPSKLSPEKQPNGQNSFELANEMINTAINTGSNRFRWYHKRKNGQVFPAEVSLTLIKENGTISAIYSTVKDISNQVRKEELEEVVYNISNAASTIADFNEFSLFIRNELQKIIETNNFYIAMYDEKSGMISTPVFVDEKEEIEVFPAEKSLTGYVIKTKKSLIINRQEYQELIKSGAVDLIGEPAEKWVGVPLKINENVIGAIVVQSYVNENAYTNEDVNLLEFVSEQISAIILRKKNEKDLQNAVEKAQESDLLKSSFLANMSHEIRTPMNGIIGFAELLLNPNLEVAQREIYAKVVIKSGHRLLSIVNDILDISKIESGVVQLKNEDISLNKLIDELEQFFKPNAIEKNLQLLTKKALDNKNCMVKLDKTKIIQILTNLISNSFKYTQKGSIEFGYIVNQNELEFFVKDTGIGIDKKLQSDIFNRFVQEDNQYNISNKGTGLGLAISKKLVKLWNGEISLNSNEKGTIINFTAPFNQSKQPEISTVINSKNWKNTMKTLETTILFVEDEEYNMLYITELFSTSKIIILEASNGRKAIELATTHPEIEMVFMDLKMPIMDGRTAMLEIKKIKPKLPIIALSAFAMESDKIKAIQEGFDDYLTKPIEKDKLLAFIHKYHKE